MGLWLCSADRVADQLRLAALKKAETARLAVGTDVAFGAIAMTLGARGGLQIQEPHNLGIVQPACAAFGRGDIPTLLTYVADDGRLGWSVWGKVLRANGGPAARKTCDRGVP